MLLTKIVTLVCLSLVLSLSASLFFLHPPRQPVRSANDQRIDSSRERRVVGDRTAACAPAHLIQESQMLGYAERETYLMIRCA